MNTFELITFKKLYQICKILAYESPIGNHITTAAICELDEMHKAVERILEVYKEK